MSYGKKSVMDRFEQLGQQAFSCGIKKYQALLIEIHNKIREGDLSASIALTVILDAPYKTVNTFSDYGSECAEEYQKKREMSEAYLMGALPFQQANKALVQAHQEQFNDLSGRAPQRLNLTVPRTDDELNSLGRKAADATPKEYANMIQMAHAQADSEAITAIIGSLNFLYDGDMYESGHPAAHLEQKKKIVSQYQAQCGAGDGAQTAQPGRSQKSALTRK